MGKPYDNPAYPTIFKLARETVDKYVGKIFDAVQKAGILDDTLFILTSDHGGVLKGHGGISPAEMNICFGAVGKTVQKSSTLKLKGRDFASIVCLALNLKTNKNWSSTIPKEFFKGD